MSMLHFEINNQALAVWILIGDDLMDTHKLTKNNPRYVRFSPWYNGVERGVCFCLENVKTNERLVIAVFEHRRRLCALKWEEPLQMEPPMTTDTTRRRAYKGGTIDDVDFSVAWGEIGKMARWIQLQFRQAKKEQVINETK